MKYSNCLTAKVTSLVFVGVGLVACLTSTDTEAQVTDRQGVTNMQRAASESDNVEEFIQRYVEAWNSRKLKAMEPLWDPEGTLLHPLLGNEPLPGYLVPFNNDRAKKLSPDLTWTLLDWASRNDRVFLEWEVTMTVSGEPFSYRGVDVMVLDNGKIVHEVVYSDTSPLWERLDPRMKRDPMLSVEEIQQEAEVEMQGRPIERKVAWTETTIEHEGTRLHIALSGKGPLVLLLQMFENDTRRHFSDIIPAILNAGYSIGAMDIRGFGESHGPLDQLTFHDFTADVAAVLDRIDRGPAHVVGHAFAGKIATCLAIDHPEVVRTVSVMAVDGLAGFLKTQPGAIPPSQELLRQYVSIHSPLTPAEVRLNAIQYCIYSPNSGARARHSDYEIAPETGRAIREADRLTPREDWANPGAKPFLIIAGVDDRVAPVENARSLKSRLGSSAELVEISNAGHSMIPEQPDAVAVALVSFFERH